MIFLILIKQLHSKVMSTSCGSGLCNLTQGECRCGGDWLVLTRSQAEVVVGNNPRAVKTSHSSCKIAYSDAALEGNVVAEYPASGPTGRGFVAVKPDEKNE